MDYRGDDPQVVIERLRLLARRFDRGLVALGVVEPAAEAAFAHALGEAEGLGAVERVGPDEPERARRLNRMRDVLARQGTTVMLTAADEAGLRRIQADTMDLTATPDLTFELAAPAAAVNRGAVLERLRALARDRAARVDLSGLLPGDVGTRPVPVDQLYVDLVDLRSAGGENAPAAGSLERLLVLGQPGSGKTTFLRMLAHDHSAVPHTDRLGVGARVPVYVPLPAYARALEERRASLPLLAFVGGWLEEQGIAGARVLAEDAREVLLLLDGLDEVPGSTTRREVVEAALRAAREGGPAVVIAGRTLVLDDLTNDQLRALAVRYVREPTEEDVRAVLERHFRARAIDRPEAEAEAVERRIREDPELADLARTPLLLVFLAILHELEGRIPDRRFLLYHKIAEILLDRWERARARARGAGAPSRVLALGDTRRVVGALAWWMLGTGRDEVGAAELTAELDRIERARGATAGEAAARATALSEVLRTGSALFASSGERRWRFVHATLAEYFAGVEAARGGPRWTEVLADVFRPDWLEVVTFAAGELGVRADDARLEQLATALLRPHRRGGRYGANQAALLGAVLREDPGFSPGDLRRLVHRFVDLCFVPKYWPRSRPGVARALRATAAVGPWRTWGAQLRDALVAAAEAVDWRDDHAELAAALPLALADLGTPLAERLARMTAAAPEPVRFAGWRARVALTPPDARAAAVAAALDALPERRRFHFTFAYPSLRPEAPPRPSPPIVPSAPDR